jgi:predicted ATPase
LSAAGDTERAVDQWLKAGQRAAERSAHAEAIGHFERGLGTLAVLPEGSARDGREIELQLARGLSLLTAKGLPRSRPRRHTLGREISARSAVMLIISSSLCGTCG